MQTTMKEFKEMCQKCSDLYDSAEAFYRNENMVECNKQRAERKQLNIDYFDKLNVVSVKYWIGNRQYFEKAHKIGKSLYDCISRKRLNNSNGYHSIEIITSITQEMRQEVLSDLLFY